MPPDELEPPIVIEPPDELEPDAAVPPDELEPPVVIEPPDELEPPVATVPPEELELDEPAPVILGEPDPPEPDEVGAPEPDALELELPDPPAPEPDPLGPPPAVADELDPLAAFPPEELEFPGVPVAVAESPHAEIEPDSPQRIAKVVRKCMGVRHAVARSATESSVFALLAVLRNLYGYAAIRLAAAARPSLPGAVRRQLNLSAWGIRDSGRKRAHDGSHGSAQPLVVDLVRVDFGTGGAVPHELLSRSVEGVDDERSFDEVVFFIFLEPPWPRMRMRDLLGSSAGSDANQEVRLTVDGQDVAVALKELTNLLPNPNADFRRGSRAPVGGGRAFGRIECERSVLPETCRGRFRGVNADRRSAEDSRQSEKKEERAPLAGHVRGGSICRTGRRSLRGLAAPALVPAQGIRSRAESPPWQRCPVLG